jgi:hypothetical protein
VLHWPEGFEPLVDEPWDEQRVSPPIRAIVADTDDAYDADRLWPACLEVDARFPIFDRI